MSTTRSASASTRSAYWVPAGLIALAFVPVIAGSLRVVSLAGGPAVAAENAAFEASPVPVLVHIVAATVYSVLGAFQFVPSLRRGRWHRIAGRVLVPAGLLVALSGLWMTAFFPRPENPSAALTGIRLVVGVAMATFIVLGFLAVLRRDFTGHRAWMMRGYALGMGAGTQAFTTLPWIAVVGPLDRASTVVTMLAGWLINATVAEWFIHKGQTRIKEA